MEETEEKALAQKYENKNHEPSEGFNQLETLASDAIVVVVRGPGREQESSIHHGYNNMAWPVSALISHTLPCAGAGSIRSQVQALCRATHSHACHDSRRRCSHY
jgi:hypothetical protein